MREPLRRVAIWTKTSTDSSSTRTGRRFTANHIGADPLTEIAVLQFNHGGEELPHFDLSASTTAEPGARAERPDAAVRRQPGRYGAEREDDDLVGPRTERAELGHGRGERGVSRVDLLGDDDEPHGRG